MRPEQEPKCIALEFQQNQFVLDRGTIGCPLGAGVSYCFGCKDSISDFNGSVANCQAEATAQIEAWESPNNSPDYRGNIGNTDTAECLVGAGTADWAGLFEVEYNRFRDNGVLPFNPAYWAGIDCSGLIQRSVDGGRSAAPGLSIAIPAYPGDVNSQGFFTDAARVSYMSNPTADDAEKVKLQKKLKRGDLTRYGRHVSIIHSEKQNCSNTTCTYDVIHASGNTCLDIDGNGECEEGDPFNRKVVVNSTQLFGKIPTGFGRIKLWD